MPSARAPVALLTILVSLALGCGGSSSVAPASSIATASTAADATKSPGTAAARRQLPLDFLGLVSEHAFAAETAERANILAAQKRTGVQLLRQTFDWSMIETQEGRYDFSAYDAFVHATARARIRLLPIIFRAPPFRSRAARRGAELTATTTFPPRSNAEMARFASVLVKRYGPNGSFWRANPQLPKMPIRSWQVWNEPNLPQYWGGRPNAREYVAMLRTVGRAIHAADRRAEVVTGGIPNSKKGIPLRTYLRSMRRAGGLKTFDTLAIHPYARDDSGTVRAVVSTRRLLNSWGRKRTPIWVTEIGWASQGPRSSFTPGPGRQARYILKSITTLGRRASALGVRGVVYYGWRDAVPFAGGTDFWGLHTGLLRLNGAGKPALSAYFQAAGVLDRIARRRRR